MSTALSSRREFLRGRPIARTVREVSHHAGATRQFGDLDTGTAGVGALVSISRRAMGCTFEILLPVGTPDALEAGSAALDLIERLEEQMTVYRDDSEVARINALAAFAAMPVEERLFGLFERAVALSEATGGAFDMTAGALVKAWGFLRGPKRVPRPAELAEVLTRVGYGHAVLDRANRTIAFRRPVELNLGAIGKGYALDRAAALLRDEWGVESALLQGGYSSVYAVGAPPTDERGWLVGIRNPARQSDRIACVRLRDRAMGTSGDAIQFFEQGGRRYGHILDPRSGWPARGTASVSVLAPSAADADALSTAFFIQGHDAARDWCSVAHSVAAIVVPEPATGAAVQPICLGIEPAVSPPTGPRGCDPALD
jgi:thiamine biosynthesis lipoprotein